MKKIVAIILLFILTSVTGCASKKGILFSKYEDLYSSNFSFVEMHTRFKEGVGEYQYGYEGEFIAEPYEKHLVVVCGESQWSELRTYISDAKLKGEMKIGDTWQEVSVGNDKFTGYNERESIHVVSMKTEELDGRSYDVYDTEYIVKAGKDLEGIVKQQYYVSKETGKIAKIISDITEEDVINSINILMQVNEISLEEAEKMVNRDEHKHIIEIDISY